MSQKTTGVVLVGVGIVLLVLSVLIFAAGSGETEPASAASSTTTTIQITVGPSSTTTTSGPARGTTTTEAATTSTINHVPDVTVFVEQFADAIDTGDTAFVQSRLHPDIVEGFGADVCATWVEAEIMAISEYRATGEPQGPTEGTLATPAGTVEFVNRYSVPVSFVFGGESFETTADFIVQNGTVYFTGTCE